LKQLAPIIFLCLSPLLLLGAEEDRSREISRISIENLEKVKEVDYVFFLMQKRLAIMHEVARWKWNTKTAIEELPFEKQLLKKIGKLASAYGLEKSWALNFFHAQTEAAILLQQRDFAIWEEQEIKEFENTADLYTEIKPYLERMNKQIIEAIVDIAPYLEDTGIMSLVPAQPLSFRPYDFIDVDVWQKAIEPFYEYKS